MRGEAAISPVYRLGQKPEEQDPLEQYGRIERLRRKAWRDLGIVAVPVDQMPDTLRYQLESWAEAEYGKRA